MRNCTAGWIKLLDIVTWREDAAMENLNPTTRQLNKRSFKLQSRTLVSLSDAAVMNSVVKGCPPGSNSCAVMSAAAPRKRRKRTNLDAVQLATLDGYFQQNARPDNDAMAHIARSLQLNHDVSWGNSHDSMILNLQTTFYTDLCQLWLIVCIQMRTYDAVSVLPINFIVMLLIEHIITPANASKFSCDLLHDFF